MNNAVTQENAEQKPKTELPVASPERALSVDEKRREREARYAEIEALLRRAYARTSELTLTEKEDSILAEPFAPEQLDILPTGEIYIPHILLRERLTRAFGRGQWALIRRRDSFDPRTNRVYVECVLLVRGVAVGEAQGDWEYVPENPRMSYTDALEAAQADALRRICGKTLMCGSQVWDPAYVRWWKARYAVEVPDCFADGKPKLDRNGKPKMKWVRVLPNEHQLDAPEERALSGGASNGEPPLSYLRYNEETPFVLIDALKLRMDEAAARRLIDSTQPAEVAGYGKSKGKPVSELSESALIAQWSTAHDVLLRDGEVTEGELRLAVSVMLAAHQKLMEAGHQRHLELFGKAPATKKGK